LVFTEFEHISGYRDVACYFVGSPLIGTTTATKSRQKLEIELEGELGLDSSPGSLEEEICPGRVDMHISLPYTENGKGEHEVIEEQEQKT
jgi:hypothetical protein